MIKSKVFNKGFTLIEVLVVVLIIGVLSSIAIPQYMKSVEKSRYAEAAEHLRSIYTAQQDYALHHNRYAEKFDELYLDFSDVALESTPTSITVRNYEISLDGANDDVPLVKAHRMKGDVNTYSIYKDLRTGDMLCEDMDGKDGIDCELFGFFGSVTSCDDGSIAAPGQKCKAQEKPIGGGTIFPGTGGFGGSAETCKSPCTWTGSICLCESSGGGNCEAVQKCPLGHWDSSQCKCVPN